MVSRCSSSFIDRGGTEQQHPSREHSSWRYTLPRLVFNLASCTHPSILYHTTLRGPSILSKSQSLYFLAIQVIGEVPVLHFFLLFLTLLFNLKLPRLSRPSQRSLQRAYLGVSDQLHCSSLVWCKSSNLSNDTLDDGRSLRQFTLSSTSLDSWNSSGGLVASVDSPYQTGTRDCVHFVMRVTASSGHLESTVV